MNETDRTASLPPVLGVHHAAFRCFDAEETRHFYEDILGLEFAAALAFDESPGGGPLEYMHLFFKMADGNFVAFFDLPDQVDRKRFKPVNGFIKHIALKVAGEAELFAFRDRMTAAGVKLEGPIDHGFVRSIYSFDPNGIQVEITCPTEGHDRILAEEKAQARTVLAQWSAATRDRKRAADPTFA